MEGKSSPGGERKDAGNLPSATSRSTADTARRHSLPKSEILRGIKAFAEVFSEKSFVQDGGVRCHYKVTEKIPPDSFRVGFVVRGTRSAVVRNRYKRVLRESFRHEKQRLLECCKGTHLALEAVISCRASSPTSRDHFQRVTRGVQNVVAELCSRLCSWDTSVKS